MNTISASAPPARPGVRSVAVKTATQLAEFIAPSDHAGKGNRDNNRWPPPVAWLGSASSRSSGESGASFRYVKHSIDADDARRHIQSGKQCTRLAMTWADRVSFVLTESLISGAFRLWTC